MFAVGVSCIVYGVSCGFVRVTSIYVSYYTCTGACHSPRIKHGNPELSVRSALSSPSTISNCCAIKTQLAHTKYDTLYISYDDTCLPANKRKVCGMDSSSTTIVL